MGSEGAAHLKLVFLSTMRTIRFTSTHLKPECLCCGADLVHKVLRWQLLCDQLNVNVLDAGGDVPLVQAFVLW